MGHFNQQFWSSCKVLSREDTSWRLLFQVGLSRSLSPQTPTTKSPKNSHNALDILVPSHHKNSLRCWCLGQQKHFALSVCSCNCNWNRWGTASFGHVCFVIGCFPFFLFGSCKSWNGWDFPTLQCENTNNWKCWTNPVHSSPAHPTASYRSAGWARCASTALVLLLVVWSLNYNEVNFLRLCVKNDHFAMCRQKQWTSLSFSCVLGESLGINAAWYHTTFLH